MTFYNSKGKPIAYSDDDENIYLFNGVPVAYLFGCFVYSYSGVQLGWFEKGWVRDKSGACVFFTENAVGGPVRPVKEIQPVKTVKRIKPARGVRQVPAVKPVNSLSWSWLSGEQFFQ